jgi:hypothetical protein
MKSVSKIFLSSTLIAITLFISGCDGKKAAKEEIEQKGFAYNFNSFAEAIQSKNTEMVELFIKAGMDISNQKIRHAVVNSEDPVILEKMLDAGFDPNIGDSSISFIGRLVSKPDMLKVLLNESEVHIDSIDNGGYTALKRAIEGGYLESVKLLVDAGASTTGALDEAVKIEASDEMLKLLGATDAFFIDKVTFIDYDTNLMWQDDVESKTVTKDWQGAINYCKDLSLAGFDDWRLPKIEELESITDDTRSDPAIQVGFENVMSDYYWSSSSVVYNSNYAWYVGFKYGSDRYNYKSSNYYVRCVRDSK